jgi:hypothetical protein
VRRCAIFRNADYPTFPRLVVELGIILSNQTGRLEEQLISRAVFAGIVFAFAATAVAQTYPLKPVRLIVPFAAGGNVDITARQIAPGMSELLGQNVIVDNRAGAGGRTRAVNRVPACGM